MTTDTLTRAGDRAMSVDVLLVVFIPLGAVALMSMTWTWLLRRAMKRASNDTSWADNDDH